DQATTGRAPAQQRFHDLGLVGVVHLRLVEQFELAALQGQAQFAFETLALFGLGGQLAVEAGQSVAAGAFGAHQCQIRLLEQFAGAATRAAVVGNADAGADVQLVLARLEGCLEGLQDAPAAVHGCVQIIMVEQQQELIATQPGEQVAAVGERSQPVGHGTQQRVADIVAEAVVDAFEMVQVDEQQGQRQAIGKGLVQLDEQVVATGDIGQLVEVGQETQALLGALAVTDVAQQQQMAALSGTFKWRAGTFQHKAVVIAVCREFQRRLQLSLHAGPGFAVAQQVVGGSIQQVAPASVEQASRSGVGILDASLRIDNQHGHWRGADDVAQQLLTVAQGSLVLGQLLDHAVEVTG